MKILLADDDKDFLRLAHDLLTSRQYDVKTAESGEEALRLAVEDAPDLIIMDHLMPPGINGMEVLRKLKENERLRFVPVIICSATMIESSSIEKAKAAGAADYIIKPFTAQDFLKRVKSALSAGK